MHFFLFHVLPEKRAGSERPYQAVVTTVYDKTGDGGVDMYDVADKGGGALSPMLEYFTFRKTPDKREKGAGLCDFSQKPTPIYVHYGYLWKIRCSSHTKTG